jgi:cold-inducible RNA-binding protein
MNIYVGNLSRDASDEELKASFSEFGQVASAAIIKDKFTGESRGFAFVEMPSKDEAQAAITGLNGKQFKGRSLTVNEARPREDNRRDSRPRDNRGGGGGGGGRGGDRGGGGGRRGW